ncbi:single hybrid motif-containing protein [Multifurca ochricompacta]|uniref:Single hybrid motif-containing protein n=1 Tax=Multifurca ochricompacta TaxID=376703 RepID=A0AAD4M6D7_9AGAM|nr:single hybrid motif-containing protein [Multifurca ochricompacta]
MSPSPLFRLLNLLSLGLSATPTSRAISRFDMPAMSPTMTEGGIASWKKREGDSFTAGDVLLEIETDKAVIDVEAQDDGIIGKIIVQDGQKNIPVGKAIALLAEEGDDISNLEIPKDETKSRTHALSHSRPLFPSVARLLQEYDVQDPEKIKGTGIRGMLTKGDVLAFLGKASSPTGTFKPTQLHQGEEKVESKPIDLDGFVIRQLIVQSMYQTAAKARAAAAPPISAEFESIIADYLPSPPSPPASTIPPVLPSKPTSDGFLDGLI